MKVDAAMTREVRLVRPDQTIREAAQLMAEIDAGAIPVTDNDRLVGMITDRDIAVRAVAQGKPPEARIRDVMSPGILYCFDDQELDEVATNMGKNQVRRLPVIDHDKRLVGILSLGDLASKEDAGAVGRAVSQVSQQGGKHSQTARESACLVGAFACRRTRSLRSSAGAPSRASSADFRPRSIRSFLVFVRLAVEA
jgi:CBS domain-containing protein